MSLQDFCLQFKVHSKVNLITKLNINAVMNFYPSPSCNPRGPSYVDYCKYSLMKFKPWQDDSSDTWGGEGVSNADICKCWKNFLLNMGDNAPDRLQREIDNYHCENVGRNRNRHNN